MNHPISTRNERQQLSVIHCPVYVDNPYNALIQNALAGQGIRAELRSGTEYNSLARLLGWAYGQPIIHWHWISLFYQKRTLSSIVVRLLLFAGILSVIKCAGTRMVLTVHNLIPHDCPHPSIHRLANRVIGFLMDRILVHSPEAAEEVAKSYGVRHKIRCIEHVDYSSLVGVRKNKRKARVSLQLPPDERLVVWFGELRPYKGVERILSASDILAQRGIHVMLAGRPCSEAYGKKIASLAQPYRNVYTHLTWLSSEALGDLLCAADAAIFAYSESLTSGAAHMALAYEVPIVAPQTVAFAELGRLGLAVTFPNRFDSLSIADAITEAVAIDRVRFGAACKDYRARCSLESVGKKLRVLYNELNCER